MMPRRLRHALIFAVISIVPIRVYADECSLIDGYSADSLLQAKEAAELANATLRHLNAFRKFIDSRKWEDGKPMDQQMSAAEAGEFGKFQKQQEIALMKQLFESRRDRDLEVIRKLAILADKISRYGLEDSVNKDQASEEFLLAGVLLAARELLDVNLSDLSDEINKSCNLQTALESQAKGAVQEFSEIEDLSTAMSESKRLVGMYGAPIDVSKLSIADKKIFLTVVRPKLTKAQSLLQRAEDLYRLSMIEGTSKKMLAALRQDQYESPGDLDYSGTTWERWKKEGRISDRDHQLTGVLNFINTKIPAPIISDWAEIAERGGK
jgi:hypothetical protein